MKNIYFWLLNFLNNGFGELKETSYYTESHARIKVEKDGKIYTFSIICEEKTDGNS